LNDEKIISQPRPDLIKMKCPVSRAGHFHLRKRFQETLQSLKIRQKTGTIPAY